MTTSYWVHHATLSDFVGPLTAAELRAALLGGSLPPDVRVHVAIAGTAPDVFPRADWTLATDVLGMPRMPAVATDHSGPGGAGGRPAPPFDVRAEVRRCSRYRGLRVLAAVLCCAAIVLVGLVTIGDRSLRGAYGIGHVVSAALHVAVVLVVYGAFTMLADIADCHLQRVERDRAAPPA